MSKKKHKKSNPHSAPKAKQSSQPSKSVNPVVWGVGAIVVMAALIIAAVVLTQKPSNTTTSTPETTDAATTPTPTSTVDTYTPPALEEGVTYTADIEVKDFGTITVELDPSAAPVTCANFVELAQSGFYDGLTFHRIIDNFMIQGGDPNGDGTGGSEHNIVGEFSSNGYDNPISHTRGTISMARSNDLNSASSQFFIVREDSTYLDGNYAGFGTVTKGMDVVDAICDQTETDGVVPTEEQPVITSITIHTDK